MNFDTQEFQLTNYQPSGWEEFFEIMEVKDCLLNINTELLKESKEDIYPPIHLVFKAFTFFKSPKDIKCIIVGQDPYINEGEAMGIAFSVPNGKKLPPSLKNIFIELEDDGFTVIQNQNKGDLSRWCEQGVFLINTALTVRKGQSKSHSKLWVKFTHLLMKYLNDTIPKGVVVMWGNDAKYYTKFFDDSRFRKVMSAHPSPLSANRGFFESKPFTKVNNYLEDLNLQKIDWNISKNEF